MNSHERMRKIDQDQRNYLIDYAFKEIRNNSSGEVGQSEDCALLVSENTKVILALKSDIFDDFPNLECIFIYILLSSQSQRARPLKDKHLRHFTFVIFCFEFAQQLAIERNHIERRG